MGLEEINTYTAEGKLLNDSFVYTDREGRGRVFVAPKIELDSDMCAKYARLSAEKLFGIKYSPENAWNLKYVNNTVQPLSNLENGKIGDMVTFYSPSSKYNTRGDENLDRTGNRREATHVGLIVGYDINGNPIILHQYHSDIEVGLLKDIEKERGIEYVEIVRARN